MQGVSPVVEWIGRRFGPPLTSEKSLAAPSKMSLITLYRPAGGGEESRAPRSVPNLQVWPLDQLAGGLAFVPGLIGAT